ncbi:hypothetical protein FHS83_003512 [Rhizomicrobium palustre]|uniref:Uncharacterized protein n=1 Tax=Rhizomicrobium palustre TaxID=189966 RepID=A0A846N2H6_9PROT|nr:hypothetical protein [Rhizomicrobium palustre]NIK90194.1 hypothetical protein [Rhizomicrobium palustre]
MSSNSTRLSVILRRLSLFAVLGLSAVIPASAGNIAIRAFESHGGMSTFGTKVTDDLPTYSLHIDGGLLKDDSNKVFSSYKSQSTSTVADASCKYMPTWLGLRGKLAYYTTFYVVLESDPSHIIAVNSCGKAPLQRGSFEQYPQQTEANFINHAQIAGTTNGAVNRVIAAGEMDVINGRIVYMDTCSGHFQPTPESFLAYLRDTGGKSLTINSGLNTIISSGSISDAQIDSNMLRMIKGDKPARTVRAGTSNCVAYTTVFDISKNGNTATLTGGLMSVGGGPIQVAQGGIGPASNSNLKSIRLDNNQGAWIYSYVVNVETDLHLINNSIDLAFTDETNDTYNLNIRVFMYDHTVKYNSAKPNVNKVKITWN